ncbi:hypothetical protein EV121DRAFT_210906 [Schizophyllum commune]
MTEPITVIPPVYDECEYCGEEAEEVQTQMLRCSACKNKFYCSPRCQKKDWKEHKMNCSPLPVPLVPNVPERSPELISEVERAANMLKEVFGAWERIDEEESSKNLPDIERLKLKFKDPATKNLTRYELPAEFAWKTNLLDKHPNFDRVLHSLRRLFWIETVAAIENDKEREDWLEQLKSMQMPPSFPQIVPEKVLAVPGDLSPGEYEMLAQVANIKSFSLAPEVPAVAGDAGADSTYGKRWMHLAVIHKQSRASS